MQLQALDPTAFEDWPSVPIGELHDLLMAWKNLTYTSSESQRLLWFVSTPCIDWIHRPGDSLMTYLFASNDKDWNWLLDIWRFRGFVAFIHDCSNLRWSRDDFHLSTHLVIGKIEFPVENSVLEVDWPKKAVGRIPREPRYKFEYDFKTKRARASGNLWEIRKQFPKHKPCVQCADQCRFQKDRSLIKAVSAFLTKKANLTMLSPQNVQCFPDLFIGYSSRAMSDTIPQLERFQLDGIGSQDIVPKAFHMWINLNRTYRHLVSASYHDEVIVKVGPRSRMGNRELRRVDLDTIFPRACLLLVLAVAIMYRSYTLILFFVISNMLIFDLIRSPKTYHQTILPRRPRKNALCPLSSSVVNSYEGRGPGLDVQRRCASEVDRICSELKRDRHKSHFGDYDCVDFAVEKIETLEKQGYFDLEMKSRLALLKIPVGSECLKKVRRGEIQGIVGEHHIPNPLKEFPFTVESRSVIYPLTLPSSQFSNHFERFLKLAVESGSAFRPDKSRPAIRPRIVLPEQRMDTVEMILVAYPPGIIAGVAVVIMELTFWIVLWALKKAQPVVSFKFLLHRVSFFMVALIVSLWFLTTLIETHLKLIRKT